MLTKISNFYKKYKLSKKIEHLENQKEYMMSRLCGLKLDFTKHFTYLDDKYLDYLNKETSNKFNLLATDIANMINDEIECFNAEIIYLDANDVK